jgi:hypothetical protein
MPEEQATRLTHTYGFGGQHSAERKEDSEAVAA